MKKYIIIVAGGVGSRMNATLPKQFLEINGKPIIFHTIDAFQKALPDIEVIIVMNRDFVDLFKSMIGKYYEGPELLITVGGETRYHSSKNGLKLVEENSIVGIHDAARPIVSKELIQNIYNRAEEVKAIIPIVPVKESIRLVNEQSTSSKQVDRSLYRIVQTPQVFDSNLIKKAFEAGYKKIYTDDASVVEKEMGIEISLIEGEVGNIKITDSLDLYLAKELLS